MKQRQEVELTSTHIRAELKKINRNWDMKCQCNFALSFPTVGFKDCYFGGWTLWWIIYQKLITINSIVFCLKQSEGGSLMNLSQGQQYLLLINDAQSCSDNCFY